MLASRLTVVVLTCNRAREVHATVARLLALRARPAIVVVDNASTDGTAAQLAAAFPDLHVIRCHANLGAAGRNAGVACVETDYVAFCDDDTWWEDGSLERAVALLDACPQIAVLNARVITDDDGSIDPTCEAMRASPLVFPGLPGPALTGYMAGACVFRTAAFRAAGGYEPRLFIGGEEALVSLDVLAAGHAIVYCEALGVHHRASAARDSRLRRRLLARNAAWVAWLRLPLVEALAATARAFVTLRRERALRSDAFALLRGVIWACAHRRVVPDAVLALRRRVASAERRAALTAKPASPAKHAGST